MRTILSKLFQGESLSQSEAASAMDLVMTGEAVPEQVAAFLGALAAKGETVDEIVGLARSMRQHAVPLTIARRDLVDTCGTGGDGSGTFNISTATAFVLAGAGLGVVKHGNRSVSSQCGSADVLEALGIAIDRPAAAVAKAVDTFGFGFLFAPVFHPAMRHVVPVRRAIGVRTVFNMLGPLTNPAGAKRQVIGVYHPSLLEKLARVLGALGSAEVMLVRGHDGLDELSLTGPTDVAHLKDGVVRTYTVTPEEAGLKRAPREALSGGDAACNAKIILEILTGTAGAPADVVCLNAAAAFVVTDRAANLKDGVAMARDVLRSGRAMAVLEKSREVGS